MVGGVLYIVVICILRRLSIRFWTVGFGKASVGFRMRDVVEG